MSRAQLAAGYAREYETVYILRPNIDRELADGVAKRVVESITSTEGKLLEAELWGSRRLAYPIKKHFRGTYVYVKYLSRGAAVAEIERQLRLSDSVIRYQSIQVKEDVLVSEVVVDESALVLDFDLPFEADEPELPREKELGLDAPPPERRRRDHRRDDRRDDDEPRSGMDDDDDDGDELDGDVDLTEDKGDES